MILATGGIGKSFKITSNSWEYTGDGHALAMGAGAPLVNMEFVQFHPTGMVWPPSVRGLLVTESVRGDGGVLRNCEGKRFMFDYIPEFFKAETADTEEEGDRWYDDHVNNRRPPELLPRDEVARAINSEIKAGRGSPHGGVFLDIASRRPPEFIRKRLPSMYHQFMELADVDITKEPMEIGPTCHYVMGGVEVDARLGNVDGARAFRGRRGRWRHARRQPPRRQLTERPAGVRQARGRARRRVRVGARRCDDRPSPMPTSRRPRELRWQPFEREGGENPYSVQHDLQDTMQSLVGIIRKAEEVEQALVTIEDLKRRVATLSVEGHRQYNPGWHLSLDLRNMLLVSECVARAALDRKESRGGHTRDDYPMTDPSWGKINVLCKLDDAGTGVEVFHQELPVMPDDLKALFEESH